MTHQPGSPGAGELDGLRALVTGGSRGIGAAITAALVERGALVAGLDMVASEIPGGTTVIADLTDDVAVGRAVDEAARVLGGLDLVINNAGIGARGGVEDNSDDEWRRVYDVNVLGIVRTMRAALPHLRRSLVPAVVNVCSIAASAGVPQRAAYSASKGAVHALTLSMAADLVGEGIRVNSVSPGTVDTEMARGHIAAADDPAAELLAMEGRQPMGRMVSPAEVAHAVCSLLSPLASSTTGVCLPVDGGMRGLRVRGPAGRPAAPA
jgi:2-keto-3-deoxy-L-fuconate dehydrogenase